LKLLSTWALTRLCTLLVLLAVVALVTPAHAERLNFPGAPTATVEPLTDADMVEATRIAVSVANGELPAGFANTSATSAWFSIISGAMAYGDVAYGMRINGGALAGVVVARPDPTDARRMLLLVEASLFDPVRAQPALAEFAKAKAKERGKSLVRVRVVRTTVHEPV
jgi:hypothetical protein